MKYGVRKKKECLCHENAMAHFNGGSNCDCKCHGQEKEVKQGMPCCVLTEKP